MNDEQLKTEGLIRKAQTKHKEYQSLSYLPDRIRDRLHYRVQRPKFMNVPGNPWKPDFLAKQAY